MNFTPGPWIRKESPSGACAIIEGDGGHTIATVWPDDVQKVNFDAALISAAPDLYLALRELTFDLTHNIPVTQLRLQLAKDALDKVNQK